MVYVKENWLKIRECVFLALLSLAIILRLLERTRFDMDTPLGSTLVAIGLFWIPVALGALYGADVLITGIKNNFKKMVFDGVVGIFFILAAYSSTDFYLLATGALLVNAHKSNVKNIAKVVAASLFTGTVVIGLLSQVGVVDDKLFNRFGRTAHAFGFRHYAFPARQLLFAWTAYICAKTKKMSWIELAIHAVCIYLIYYFTTQRLTFIMFIAVWMMYVVFVKIEIIKINNIFMKTASVIGFSACAAFSILVSFFYDNTVGWMSKLDRILNTRLRLGKEAFSRYDITLLGQYVKDIGIDSPEGYFYIDCGYLDVLISLGIVVFAITLLAYTFIHWYSCHKNDTGLFIWVTAIMVYTIVDCVWLDLLGAGSVILLFGVAFNEFKKEKTLNVKNHKNDLLE